MKIDFSIPMEKSLGASNTKIQTVPLTLALFQQKRFDAFVWAILERFETWADIAPQAGQHVAGIGAAGSDARFHG